MTMQSNICFKQNALLVSFYGFYNFGRKIKSLLQTKIFSLGTELNISFKIIKHKKKKPA